MEGIVHVLQETQAVLNTLVRVQANITSNPASVRERTLTEIKYLTPFSGKNIQVAAFIQAVEYYLNRLEEGPTKKLAVATIFLEKIQGEAKRAVINISDIEDWQIIKTKLKQQYKPEYMPEDLYYKISNIKVHSVSDLLEKLYTYKNKAEELRLYYKDTENIDLTGVESLLVNTVKRITQGTLAYAIKKKNTFQDIVDELDSIDFEDNCIRNEYRIFENKNFNFNKRTQNLNKFKTNFRTSNHNKSSVPNVRENNNRTFQNNFNQNTRFQRTGNNYNQSNNYQRQSGNFNSNYYRNNNNNNQYQYQRGNQSNNYRNQSGNHGYYNNQGQNAVVPMDVDHISVNNSPQSRQSNNHQLLQQENSPQGNADNIEVGNFFINLGRNIDLP